MSQRVSQRVSQIGEREMKELPAVNWKDRDLIVREVIKRVPIQLLFLRFIGGVAKAERTRDLLRELKLEWTDFTELYHSNLQLRALYELARVRGEELRQMTREDEADRRAMEGTLKPQFHKGKVCGYVREYSDHLLALQLKAGNPDRYADRQQLDVRGTVLNLNVEGVTRAPMKKVEEPEDTK